MTLDTTDSDDHIQKFINKYKSDPSAIDKQKGWEKLHLLVEKYARLLYMLSLLAIVSIEFFVGFDFEQNLDQIVIYILVFLIIISGLSATFSQLIKKYITDIDLEQIALHEIATAMDIWRERDDRPPALVKHHLIEAEKYLLKSDSNEVSDRQKDVFIKYVEAIKNGVRPAHSINITFPIFYKNYSHQLVGPSQLESLIADIEQQPVTEYNHVDQLKSTLTAVIRKVATGYPGVLLLSVITGVGAIIFFGILVGLTSMLVILTAYLGYQYHHQ